MSPWDRLLERPQPRGHYVQLFRSVRRTLNNAGFYLATGLAHGESAIVVATPEHRAELEAEIASYRVHVADLEQQGRLVFLDAQDTLNQFTAGGRPHWNPFANVVGGMVRRAQGQAPGGLRAYGEMVGLLWKTRQYSAAVQLEQFWNRLLAESPFSLFCGYSIDLFSEFHCAALEAIVDTHTHVVPAERNGPLNTAFDRAIGDVMGTRGQQLRGQARMDGVGSAVMPNVEAMTLWLHKHQPDRAREILARTRHHYDSLAEQ